MRRMMASRRSCHYTTSRCCIITVVFGTLTSMVSGCALLKKDLVRAGTIRLEEARSDVARLSRVHVCMDDGELVVYGKLGRKPDVDGRIDGTVRVVVRFPDGRTLEETTRAIPRYLPIRRSRKSNFTVRFQALWPTGAVVWIECPPMTTGPSSASSSLVSFHVEEMRL